MSFINLLDFIFSTSFVYYFYLKINVFLVYILRYVEIRVTAKDDIAVKGKN